MVMKIIVKYLIDMQVTYILSSYTWSTSKNYPFVIQQPIFTEEIIMKNITFFLILFSTLFSTVAFSSEEDFRNNNSGSGTYALQELIDIALQNNPAITALGFELEAADARIKQSSLWPNPEFSAETENFSGDLPGFNYTENTFSLTQPLSLGGKINLQKKLSEQENRCDFWTVWWGHAEIYQYKIRKCLDHLWIGVGEEPYGIQGEATF